MEEKLVLVTSTPRGTPIQHQDGLRARGLGTRFFTSPWGESLESKPGLFVNLGPLGLSYVLAKGGSGYFRMRAVRPHLKAGKLRLVPRSPEYSYPIYVVYSDNAQTIQCCSLRWQDFGKSRRSGQPPGQRGGGGGGEEQNLLTRRTLARESVRNPSVRMSPDQLHCTVTSMVGLATSNRNGYETQPH